MNNGQLKLLAAALMVVDHIGWVFFPHQIWLRFVGRLCMPLFVFLAIQGEKHTKNFGLYAFRLFVLGLLSQPIYDITFNYIPVRNILFALLLGICLVRVTRHFPHLSLLSWPVGIVAASFLRLDYGFYGQLVFLVVGLRNKVENVRWWIYWILIHIGFYAGAPQKGLSQLTAIPAGFLFYAASAERGARMRWFYLFYPLHLLIIAAVRHALTDR